jgi:tetratricopeptide (TPR) repeat protein
MDLKRWSLGVVLLFAMLAPAGPTRGLHAQAQTATDGRGTPPPSAAPTQRPRDLVFEADAPPATVPRGYAVVIGVAQYERLDPSMQLRFPESDAEAIYRVLISQEGGAFPPENVRLLKGSAATLANIRSALEEWLPSVAQPADRVVVYFAGHGFVQGGRGYLAPWDVDPERLVETAYSMDTLGDVLANRVKANWKVLLADACHSGKIGAETTNEALEEKFNALPSRFLTLTATGGNEQSFEDPNLSTGFGLYTYFVVQAFRGYSDNDPCDGRITADELVGYVRSNVRRYAREHQLSQTPTARGDYEPGMLLGVSRECLADAAADRAPSMLGTAVVEANLDGVTLYIDGALIGSLSSGKPLVVPSLPAGLHEFVGEKAGYEPDRQQVMIAPGQESTVTLRIRYARRIRKQASDLNAQGERLLFSRRSSMSLLNLVPAERAQGERDLREAIRLFDAALADDPSFEVAAYHLGQAQQLLGNLDDSVRQFRRAIALDATHVAARVECAAALIERGDADEAIRELTDALRLDPSEDDAHAMLARAYWDKAAWPRAIEEAGVALALNGSNAQAYLWRADASRQLAAAEQAGTRRQALYGGARDDYRAFLDLTNFSSGLGSRLAFHFVGLGVGRRSHADRQVAYDSLRSAGFLGLCLTEQKVGNALRARDYCRRALAYTPDDPIAYFVLGNINRDLFNTFSSCRYLVAARDSYERMLRVNGDIDEARNARNYLKQIEPIARTLDCHG